MLTIWALDSRGIRRGMLSPISAKAVERDCDQGTWVVEIDLNSPLAERISEDWYLVIRDESINISGPINRLETNVEAQQTTLIISGVDELSRLKDRLIYPNAVLPAGSQDIARYQDKGVAETVIKRLVNLNCAAGALPARISQGLVVDSDYKQGTNVVVSERLTNLLDVCKSLARAGGVTFKAVRDDDGLVHFTVRKPRDKSRQVRFIAQTGGSSTGNLAIESAKVTTAIVAGQGEGAERFIDEISRDPGNRRIEALKDRRDTDEADVVKQAGNDLLDDNAATASANVEISETFQRQYGTHFLLGDVITVQLGSIIVSKPIRSVEIEWDGFGRTVKLSVGDHDSADDKSPKWVQEIKNLNTRIRNLEVI